MRRITKLPAPSILQEKSAEWTSQFIEDQSSKTKKLRYRHPDIKKILMRETASKCAYCESKIGHNTPGDVEHKIPSSVDPKKHFDWENLTVACVECNRRKNDYFSETRPFIDPYMDDVEARLIHLGPVVSWTPGDVIAEIAVQILQLCGRRTELINRKVETIGKLNDVVARMKDENPLIREIMAQKLGEMKSHEQEYSAMILSICEQYGL